MNDIESMNAENCPHCNRKIARHEEKLIHAGKEWHLECYKSIQGPEKLANNRIDEKIENSVLDVVIL